MGVPAGIDISYSFQLLYDISPLCPIRCCVSCLPETSHVSQDTSIVVCPVHHWYVSLLSEDRRIYLVFCCALPDVRCVRFDQVRLLPSDLMLKASKSET